MLIGGLARIDVVSSPGSSLYLTLWLPPLVTCHMGKAENAPAVLDKHAGVKLQVGHVACLAALYLRSAHLRRCTVSAGIMTARLSGIGWFRQLKTRMSPSDGLQAWCLR